GSRPSGRPRGRAGGTTLRTGRGGPAARSRWPSPSSRATCSSSESASTPWSHPNTGLQHPRYHEEMKVPGERGRWLAVWAAMLAAQIALRAGYTVAGLALLVTGFWGLRSQDAPVAGRTQRSTGWWLAGAALVLAALALRLWRLESVPPVWWDEGVEGHDARCVAA